MHVIETYKTQAYVDFGKELGLFNLFPTIKSIKSMFTCNYNLNQPFFRDLQQFDFDSI